jgi:transcriptional regulator with XRE-family HTH domain
MHIGDTLRAMRREAKLTQRDLAERLHLSQARVETVERSGNMTVAVLDRFVRALDGELEVNVIKDGQRIPLVGAPRRAKAAKPVTKKKSTARKRA